MSGTDEYMKGKRDKLLQVQQDVLRWWDFVCTTHGLLLRVSGYCTGAGVDDGISGVVVAADDPHGQRGYWVPFCFEGWYLRTLRDPAQYLHNAFWEIHREAVVMGDGRFGLTRPVINACGDRGRVFRFGPHIAPNVPLKELWMKPEEFVEKNVDAVKPLGVTREQADILTTLLDVATQGHWRDVADAMTGERGYAPADIVDAWQALERTAGKSGTAPTEGDF